MEEFRGFLNMSVKLVEKQQCQKRGTQELKEHTTMLKEEMVQSIGCTIQGLEEKVATASMQSEVLIRRAKDLHLAMVLLLVMGLIMVMAELSGLGLKFQR